MNIKYPSDNIDIAHMPFPKDPQLCRQAINDICARVHSELCARGFSPAGVNSYGQTVPESHYLVALILKTVPFKYVSEVGILLWMQPDGNHVNMTDEKLRWYMSTFVDEHRRQYTGPCAPLAATPEYLVEILKEMVGAK